MNESFCARAERCRRFTRSVRATHFVTLKRGLQRLPALRRELDRLNSVQEADKRGDPSVFSESLQVRALRAVRPRDSRSACPTPIPNLDRVTRRLQGWANRFGRVETASAPPHIPRLSRISEKTGFRPCFGDLLERSLSPKS